MVKEYNYINIREVLSRVLRHPLLQDVTLEQVIQYTVDFIRIVGCPRIFHERTQILHIKDYRAALPCDYESMIQVRTHGESNHKHEVFRYTTDSFHMSEDKHGSYDLTYKIQGGVIFTSMRDGDIEIAYNAFPIDEDGYPAIIDNSSFTRALEFYIKKQCFTVLFDQGKITPAVYNQVLQDYAWAVGQAQSDLVRPTIDQMQALTNSLNTLVPRVNEHSSGFVNNGSMEKLRL